MSDEAWVRIGTGLVFLGTAYLQMGDPQGEELFWSGAMIGFGLAIAWAKRAR